MKKLFLIVTIVFGFAIPAYSSDQAITHVVIVWANEEVSEGQVSEIIDKTDVLSTIDAVQALKIGRPVMSERKIVDDSFTFAISVEFKNKADMQRYLEDETHLKYVQTVLTPVVKKFVVYDF